MSVFVLTVEGAYSVLLGKVVGSLIRANTVIAKFRPLRTSHLLPERAGAAHKYSRGCRFWCCIGRGGGENKLFGEQRVSLLSGILGVYR